MSKEQYEVPKEIADLQAQFNSLQEQRQIELLVLSQLKATEIDNFFLKPTLTNLEQLNSALSQISLRAIVWSHQHGYKFHSEPEGTRFWVEKIINSESELAPEEGVAVCHSS